MSEKNIESQKKAFIRDDALILYFETAETPFVARFDLDSLVQANFEVVSRDGQFLLTLRDFSGDQQTVGQFASKTDAHQALYAILQALLSYNRPDGTSAGKTSSFLSGLGRFIKWVVLIAIATVAIYWVLVVVLAPSSPEKTPVHEAVQNQVAPQSEPNTSSVPEGEPADLESMLPAPAADQPSP